MSQASSGNPYRDYASERSTIRVFDPGVDHQELVWHRDREDREVRILQSNGWSYQMDNELPLPLLEGDAVFIPKGVWHRVRRGSGPLVIEIVPQ